MSNYKRPYVPPSMPKPRETVLGMRDSLPRTFSKAKNISTVPEIMDSTPPLATKYPPKQIQNVTKARSDLELMRRSQDALMAESPRNLPASKSGNSGNFQQYYEKTPKYSPDNKNNGTLHQRFDTPLVSHMETYPEPDLMKRYSASRKSKNDSLNRSLDTPIITHESLYPEPDLMRRYSVSKARTRSDGTPKYNSDEIIPKPSGGSSVDENSDQDLFEYTTSPIPNMHKVQERRFSKPANGGSFKKTSPDDKSNTNRKSIFSRAFERIASTTRFTSSAPSSNRSIASSAADPHNKSFYSLGSAGKSPSVASMHSNDVLKASSSGSKKISYFGSFAQRKNESKRSAFSSNPKSSNSANNMSDHNGTGVGGGETIGTTGGGAEISGGLEQALQQMGIANRQEGDMDFESALLLVHLDPIQQTHQKPSNFITNVSTTPTTNSNYKYDMALRANEEILERLSVELGSDHLNVIALKAATADMYKGLGMPHASETLLRQVLDSQRHLYEPSHIEIISTINDLALLLMSMHRYREAQDYFDEIRPLIALTQGEEHADCAVIDGNLALALRGLGDFTGALKFHERAVAIMEVALGVDHADTIYQRAQLGITYIRMSTIQKGKRILKEAVTQLREKNYPETHPWIVAFLLEDV